MEMFMILSNLIVPAVILGIVCCGAARKVQVYDAFIEGANDGFRIVVKIMPTMVALMIAVGILRASGFLDLAASLLGRFTDRIGFPGELVPLTIVKMFSSSAATGLLLDIFKEFGTDTYTGLVASVSMSCTETIFYTMSVYFMTAKVTKTRFTLPGALIATFAGLAASVVLAAGMAQASPAGMRLYVYLLGRDPGHPGWSARTGLWMSGAGRRRPPAPAQRRRRRPRGT